ncbi:terminase family protein [Frankia sp. Mgl5]|uniref:phage terminase large subunit family protein n=1 Tax=Frankia sp. Mgl5 TaxID=2933793 RepID=UPI00200C105E|nr:terminase family protein [Frankia sp. Mgl5]MCK9929339.1 terminase family protein [Frankia sp. Mgl5]
MTEPTSLLERRLDLLRRERELRAQVDAAEQERPKTEDPSPGALAARITRGREMQARHLDLIDSAFVDIAERRTDRVALFMPPRRGKSRRAARWGALWYLRRFPERRVVIASYAAGLAEEHGRWIRDELASGDHGIKLRPGSRAANRLDIDGQDGGLVAVGIGGGLTGKGADLLIIDDPVKDRKDADSPTIRKSTWEWFTDVASTRLHPGAAVVLIQTRWHEDDLGGRILAREADEWRVLTLPELAERDDDLLGRPRGEPLWPERYDLAADLRTRKSLGGRSWNALYQQRPAAPEGAVFKRAWFRWCNEADMGTLGVVAVSVDPAITDGDDADDTGIVVTARGTGDRRDDAFVLADRTCHDTPAGWGRAACLAAIDHQADALVVEDNQGGQMTAFVLRTAWQALEKERRTRGMSMPAVVRVHARDGKRIRAEPIAALYEAGRVWHHGEHADLEDQMCSWVGDKDSSPDRMDAVVTGISWVLRLGHQVRKSKVGDRRLASR